MSLCKHAVDGELVSTCSALQVCSQFQNLKTPILKAFLQFFAHTHIKNYRMLRVTQIIPKSVHGATFILAATLLCPLVNIYLNGVETRYCMRNCKRSCVIQGSSLDFLLTTYSQQMHNIFNTEFYLKYSCRFRCLNALSSGSSSVTPKLKCSPLGNPLKN
jgi:hypothetical protein